MIPANTTVVDGSKVPNPDRQLLHKHNKYEHQYQW
jgi:hypothetical protein